MKLHELIINENIDFDKGMELENLIFNSENPKHNEKAKYILKKAKNSKEFFDMYFKEKEFKNTLVYAELKKYIKE